MPWTTQHLLLSFSSGVLLAVVIDHIRHRRRWPSSLSDAASPIKVDRESTNPDSIPPPPASIGLSSAIGNTPLILLESLSHATGCKVYAKCEFLNPGGSPKDRVALSILTSLERSGHLTPSAGDTIYEGTVGSTGISLATLARARGYLAHIVMPSDQAAEKSDLLRKLGAVVERVTPAPIVDPGHFVNRARSLAAAQTADASTRGRGVFADQFETDANWRAHYEGTGREIYTQLDGEIDAFVAGAGTGGTISGVALYLKEHKPSVKVVLADPQGSGAYNKVEHGVFFHSLEREGTRRRDQVDSVIEGIGLTRSTKNFERGLRCIDSAVRVTDQQARNMARYLVEREGIFVGGSSAVNCVAALRTAMNLGTGNTVVTVLCDSGMRHLSKFWGQIGEIGGEAKATVEDILEGKVIE